MFFKIPSHLIIQCHMSGWLCWWGVHQPPVGTDETSKYLIHFLIFYSNPHHSEVVFCRLSLRILTGSHPHYLFSFLFLFSFLPGMTPLDKDIFLELEHKLSQLK